MKILVLNSGSSSLKYRLIEMPAQKTLMKGHVDAIGQEKCTIKFQVGSKKTELKKPIKDHLEAVLYALDSLKKEKIITSYNEISAIGHRVVHGGEFYKQAVLVDDTVIKNIKSLSELAPLHNPPNLAGIMACKKALPHTIQVAVFDTAFHQTIPKHAFIYGIPMEFYKSYGIRKYGFHGISHKYLSEQAAKIIGKKQPATITCHLGNGSSITAIKNGKSVDTTMGFTPLDGLMMGTRPGMMDPEIPLYLLKKGHYTIDELEEILNKKSGILGITKNTCDVRDVWERYNKGDSKAKLVIDMLSYKILFYIGGYMSILGKLDSLVFSGGIGENAWYIRERVLDSLTQYGLKYDKEKNKKNEVIISTPDSKIQVLIIPTNEELEIAKESMSILTNNSN